MALLDTLGVVVPTDPKQAPYLLGAKCSSCGTVVFPKMPVCPACHRNGVMKEVEIGRRGRIFSHTIAHFAPKGFKAPLFQIFIDLHEGPRIFSLVGAECPVEKGVLENGMEMQLVIEPLADTPENKNVLTYKYVPIATGGKIGGNGHA